MTPLLFCSIAEREGGREGGRQADLLLGEEGNDFPAPSCLPALVLSSLPPSLPAVPSALVVSRMLAPPVCLPACRCEGLACHLRGAYAEMTRLRLKGREGGGRGTGGDRPTRLTHPSHGKCERSAAGQELQNQSPPSLAGALSLFPSFPFSRVPPPPLLPLNM